MMDPENNQRRDRDEEQMRRRLFLTIPLLILWAVALPR